MTSYTRSSAWATLFAVVLLCGPWVYKVATQTPLEPIDWTSGILPLAIVAFFCFVPGRIPAPLQWATLVTMIVFVLLWGSKDRPLPPALVDGAGPVCGAGLGLLLLSIGPGRSAYPRLVGLLAFFLGLMALLLAASRYRLAFAAGALLLVVLATRILRAVHLASAGEATPEGPEPTGSNDPAPDRAKDAEPEPRPTAEAEPAPHEPSGGELQPGQSEAQEPLPREPEAAEPRPAGSEKGRAPVPRALKAALVGLNAVGALLLKPVRLLLRLVVRGAAIIEWCSIGVLVALVVQHVLVQSQHLGLWRPVAALALTLVCWCAALIMTFRLTAPGWMEGNDG